MSYKLTITEAPKILADGRIRCTVEISKDGAVVERRTMDRKYPNTSDGFTTARDRIRAFVDGFQSIPDAMKNTDEDNATRGAFAFAEMTDEELAKLDGMEFEAS